MGAVDLLTDQSELSYGQAFREFRKLTNETQIISSSVGSIVQSHSTAELPSGRLVDIGCGDGSLTELIAKAGRCDSAILVEPEKQLMVNAAGALNHSLSPVKSTRAFRQTIQSAYADVAGSLPTSFVVLSHVCYYIPQVLFAEIVGKASVGGVVVANSSGSFFDSIWQRIAPERSRRLRACHGLMSEIGGWHRQRFQVRMAVPSAHSIEAEVILRLAHEYLPIAEGTRRFLESEIDACDGVIELPIEIYVRGPSA